MPREIAWRRGCPVLVTQRLKQLRTIRLLCVAERGPSAFTLKHNDKKYMVSLGAVHSCTCVDSRGELCVHLLFVLSRLFRVPPENALLWQRSLLEAEVSSLVDARRRAMRYQQEADAHLAANAAQQRQLVDKKPLDAESDCPICCDSMSLTDNTVYCRWSCGNQIHSHCFREYIQHQSSSAGGGSAAITCPLCRARWSQLGDDDYADDLPKYPAGTMCDCCKEDILFGERFRCSFCSRHDLCSSCWRNKPQLHRQHPFYVQNGPNLPFLPAPERPTAAEVLAQQQAMSITSTPNRGDDEQQQQHRSPGARMLEQTLARLLERSPGTFGSSPTQGALAAVAAAAAGHSVVGSRFSNVLTLNDVMEFAVDVDTVVAMRRAQMDINGNNGDDDDDDAPSRPSSILGDCEICTGSLDGVSGFVMRLPCPCGLLLHSSCCTAWLVQGSASCPRCRAVISPVERAGAPAASQAAGSAVALLRSRAAATASSAAVAGDGLTPPRRNHAGLAVGNVLSSSAPLVEARRRTATTTQQQQQPNNNKKKHGANQAPPLSRPSIPDQSVNNSGLSLIGHTFSSHLVAPPSPPSRAKPSQEQEQQQNPKPVASTSSSSSSPSAVAPRTFEWRANAPHPSAPSIPSSKPARATTIGGNRNANMPQQRLMIVSSNSSTAAASSSSSSSASQPNPSRRSSANARVTAAAQRRQQAEQQVPPRMDIAGTQHTFL